jgi:hypothetical protein
MTVEWRSGIGLLTHHMHTDGEKVTENKHMEEGR